ncbi:MAG: efflux RND transporter periplasmic adaptor subunit [Bryobacteraceae bacterium]|nr:efflux RND transporter periplasmic adaptor subunit [Bryobacteraceae bacterium]
MKRWFAALAATLVVAAAVLWLALRKPAPPEVPFARARQETLVSILTTNGRAEPASWEPVRAAQAGRVRRVAVERGARVAAGALLVQLDDAPARTELASAEARTEAARAEVRLLEKGGRAAERAQLEGAIAKLAVELEAARRDAAALERLVEKGAAARAELDQARDRARQAESEWEAQRRRLAALVAETDLEAARARLRDAEAALDAARLRMEQTRIRAPREGVVYDLPVREGDWLEAGALVARVGQVDRLKIIIFVDEPELGRVRAGLPVQITWDALPDRRWQAQVERMPTQVVPMGTRMVGEVWAMCDNPSLDLPPGANVNVRIRAHVIENALTIPKAALRRQGDELGAYVLEGNRLVWKALQIGATSEVDAEVRSGLKPGDAVALPVDRPLQAGMEVRPVFPGNEI